MAEEIISIRSKLEKINGIAIVKFPRTRFMREALPESSFPRACWALEIVRKSSWISGI